MYSGFLKSNTTEELRSIIATSIDGFLLIDMSGYILETNYSYSQMVGYTHDQLLNMHVSEIDAIDSAEEVSKRTNLIFQNKAIRFETKHLHNNGDILDVEVSAHYSHLYGGSVFSFMRDVSHQKRTEKALVMSEQRFRSFVENANDVVFVLSAQGVFDYVSPNWTDVFGYELTETVGKSFVPFIHPDDVAGCVAFLQKILETGKKQEGIEYRVLHKDGRLIWYSANGSFLHDSDSNENKFLGIGRDITERKIYEESLYESEAHYRSLFDNSLIGVTAVNCDSIIIEANDAFCKMLEYGKKEVVGKMRFADITHPDDTKISIDYIHKIITKEIDNYSLEKRYISKTGNTITAMIYVRGLYNLDGKYKGSTASILDISEIKQAEQDKLLLEQQLHQAQKLESLGVLAGGIAHDFNNILAVIMCYSSLAQQKPEKAAELMPEIEKAADRAAGLCRQMLAYAGKTQFVESHVDVTALMDEMLSMLKSTLPQNVNIKPYLTGDIPSIKADASQISQIVMNLIINASEAIGEEQGDIVVSLTKTTIGSEQSEKDHLGKAITDGSYICLEITDTGCGMDDETKQRIFEPFYTTKFVGRGLGMSAVLGIITSHGGALQFFSRLDEGTTFKVYLPVQGDESTEEESLPQVSLLPWQGSGTILLVEDEPQLIAVAKALLESLGFSVIEASNSIEALEQYRKNTAEIRLVITDIGLPLMGGYELIAELKKINPELLIIVSSGFGDTIVSSKITPGDIAGLISKPYNFDQLRGVLKGIVGDEGYFTP